MYNTRLTSALPASLPASLAGLAHQSVGAAYGVSRQLAAHGQPAVGDAVRQAATGAFDHGLSVGSVVAGLVAVAGALLAIAFLPSQPPRQPQPEDRPAALAGTATD